MKEKNAEISARIDTMIEILHINPNKLANALGYGRAQTIYDILNGKSAPSYDFFKRFVASGYAAFINLRWLISGEGSPIIEETYYQSDLPIIKGEMTSNQAKQKLEEIRNRNNIKPTNTEYPVLTHAPKDSNQEFETRPRIPFDAAAGYLSLAIDSVAASECERLPVIPVFPRYDFTIVARGDSMTPEFQSGDELACAFVKESAFIQWGRVHVLDTAQGIVLKKIFDGKKNIVCKSINKEYPDFEVPKDEIYHIAIVVGLIRHF